MAGIIFAPTKTQWVVGASPNGITKRNHTLNPRPKRSGSWVSPNGITPLVLVISNGGDFFCLDQNAVGLGTRYKKLSAKMV